ncbi:LysR family transcriptional regulator [Aquabacter spiritensis]|uniref:DNA-binding transcriptional LysR family regulator n=1 Tax=Aquabacter spiritensis TaxID=933073 RepID=A0A4R3M387_9HYPH|nr:LysR family transcriptional regulator [Aquabacter spiritensis]TCT05625.1 DNA-binding transcriptional LysR family regulator [Aquabacter spiritensis]
MNLTVRQLEVFACAARAMSFTQAAQQLGISQPALSESIRRMETELGFRLFDRTTRRLALTQQGRALAGLAEEVARDVRDGLRDIAERGGRRPRVTIALLPSIAAALLPAAADALRRSFPDAELSVCDVPHERAVGLVEDGIADIAVTMRPASDLLAYEPLGADRAHLLMRRGHPLAGRGPIAWGALAGHSFVALARSTSVRKLVDGGLAAADVAVQPRFEVEQIPSAVALVAAGLGVTALPELTFAMFPRQGLATRLLVRPQVSRAFGLLTRAERALSPAAASLAAGLRAAANASRPLIGGGRTATQPA